MNDRQNLKGGSNQMILKDLQKQYDAFCKARHEIIDPLRNLGTHGKLEKEDD